MDTRSSWNIWNNKCTLISTSLILIAILDFFFILCLVLYGSYQIIQLSGTKRSDTRINN